jgi:PAS domain S-box-containing protein
MDISEREPAQADREARIEALVRQLSETEHALQELLAGEVDAIVDPVRGTPIILRRAQAELLRSEARARLLLEQVPAVVWTTDADLCMTSIAGRDVAMLGMTADRVIGRSLADVTEEHAGLAGVLAAHYRALEGQQASYDASVEERAYSGLVEPLHDESGRIVGCVGLGLDVTRRRRVEDVYGRKLGAARRKLEALAGRSDELAPEHRALVEEMLESSFAAVEELQVATEELHQQNEELIAIHNDLQGSRRRYQDLFESAPDGYLVTDSIGIIRRANRAAVDLLGVREEVLRDKPLVLYVAEEDRAEFHRRLDRARAGKDPGGGEWEMRVRNRARAKGEDGGVFPAALTVSPIRDWEGELAGLRWLLRDISPSRRAKERERLLEETWVVAEEVQAANTLLRTLLDTMPVGVVVCDAEGSLLMTNPPGEQILGNRLYGDVQAPGQTYTSPSDDSSFPGRDTPLARAIALGETVENVETLILRKDGSERTLLVGAAPVRDGAGQIVSGVAVFQDITTRKELEIALEAERVEAENEKRRLAAVMEALPVGVAITDLEGGNTQANSAYERVWGSPRPAAHTVSDYAAYQAWWVDTGEPVAPQEWASAQVVRTGEHVVGQLLEIQRFDGSRAFVINSAAPVRDAGGEVVGSAVAIQDITDLRKAEQALQHERNILHAIMENTHTHLAYFDPEFNFVTVNSAYAKGSGYSREELEGRNHFDLFPNPENQAIFERVRNTGEPVEFHAKPFEFPERPELGVTYWDWTLVPVKGADGQVRGLVLSLLDVTQQIRARAEIESLSRFPRENPNPVLRVARDGTLLYANKGSQPLIEAWRVQVGQTISDDWQELVAKALEERAIQVVEAPCNGRTLSLTVAPVADAGYVNLYGLDVTERVRAERAVQQYANRLQGLHEADQAILAARSVDEIAEAALRRVPDLIDCGRADVMLYDLDAGEMTLMAVYAAGETRVGAGWHGTIDEAWADVVQTLARGATHTIEDLQRAPSNSPWREALQTEQVRTLVALPLMVDGELIGSLNLGMRTLGQLSAEQMEIAHELAIQLALGIHQARLREQVQRHADELEERVQRRTAALRASQARLRAIFDNAAVGIVLVDLKGHVIESNPGLQKMLGYTSEELEGRYFVEFSHPADAEADEALFQELLAGERESYTLLKQYVRKNGGQLWGNLHVSFVRDPGGKPHFAVALVEDVTAQHEAQEALIQSEKLALTGRLAASLAHEINNPMQSVIGCLGLAQESLDTGDEGDVRELLRIAAEELDRAAETVSNLRDLNRPSKPEDRKPTDVNLQLEHLLTLTRKQCQKRGVEVEWEPDEDLPTIMLMPNRINQVFLNLVLNAVDAMSDGGRLRVSTGRADDPAWVRVTFADTGRGIAPDALPRVFDPFYTTKSEGLGLGLYVSHSIVDAHGGRIDVESQVGKGTSFTVWLPVGGG